MKIKAIRFRPSLEVSVRKIKAGYKLVPTNVGELIVATEEESEEISQPTIPEEPVPQEPIEEEPVVVIDNPDEGLEDELPDPVDFDDINTFDDEAVSGFVSYAGQYVNGNNPPLPPLDEIETNVVFQDPLTGARIRPTPPGLRHIYSDMPAFSPSEQFLILECHARTEVHGVSIPSGSIGVFRADDFSVVGLLRDAYAPVWDAHEDHVTFIRGFPGSLHKFDANTGEEEVITEYADVDTFSASASWQSPSNNGLRALVVTSPKQAIKIVDVDTGGVVREFSFEDLNVDSNGINWASLTPSGKYLAVQFNSYDGKNTVMGKGCDLWRIDTGEFYWNMAPHGKHSDFGLDDLGRDVYFTEENEFGRGIAPPDNNYPAIGIYTPDIKEFKYGNFVLPWARSEHFSGNGPAGFPFAMTAGNSYNGALKGTVYLLTAEGDIKILCNHRSSSQSYNRQPQATMSPSGKFVVFASDLDGHVRSYIVETGLVD